MDENEEAIDVWFRFYEDDDEETEAEANTYETESGYRVEWYLTAVGLVTEVHFRTLAEAYAWLEREGFRNFTG